MPGEATKKDTRAERQAMALRENLKRRKVQARGRVASAPDEAEPAEAPPPESDDEGRS